MDQNVKISPLILISGSCDYTADDALRSIKRDITHYLSEPEVRIIYAPDYAAGELSLAASPSLFPSPKLVVIKQVEECNDIFLSEALKYIQSPFEDAYVIFRHKSGVRGKKLLEELRRRGQEICCPELNTSRFVSDIFKKANQKITPAAVNMLTEIFEDKSELAQFCRQIINDTDLLSDKKGVISEHEISLLCWAKPGASVFQIVNAAMDGDVASATSLLERFTSEGGSAIPLIAAITSRLRLLIRIKYAKKITAAPWQISAAKKKLSLWTDRGFARCIIALQAADHALKGGAANPQNATEYAIRLVASQCSAP